MKNTLNIKRRRAAIFKRAFGVIVGAFMALSSSFSSSAQNFAVKSNLLYDATLTVNLGAELKVAPKWSIDLSGSLNAWELGGGKRWKHWMAQPEARYWFCDATAGHFLGFHALGGQYNIGHLDFAKDFLGVHFSELRHQRYQGWAVGGGVAYGYSWVLGKHWNFEAEVGVGYIYAKYDVYECLGCGAKVDSGHKGFFAPTKLALNIVYVF
ncbi:MAG: DUF3575 domain-containing protein [Muribaculaceae bacterium]|nr:DUF3575 domain-containing protein [Muribaculaceae bacterium]